jgi:4'-phosphopantetheinyl transferase
VSALLVLAQHEAAVPEGDGWLAPAERTRASAFRFAARRRDFRLGRWAAKRALARFLGAGEAPDDLAALEICGAPKTPPVPWWRGAPAPCALSLSHRAGVALAAVGPPGIRLGCDLERSEPRSAAFVAQFFAPAERARIAAVPAPLRSRAAALAWSAKESAVKALGRGLDLDMRALEVELAARDLARAPRWQPLHVVGPDGQGLAGFWCRRGAWLLTLVADPASAAPRWIAP